MKTLYDPNIFENTMEGITPEDYIIATYYFEQEAYEHLEVVGYMALEASTGGWIDFPGETPQVREALSARVVGYYPVESQHEGWQAAVVRLAFPMRGPTGYLGSTAAMLTGIGGNILGMPGEIKLLDIDLPAAFVKQLPGPKFGVSGIRKLLEVPQRPLVNCMIKPKVGLTPKQIGNLCYEVAVAGVDTIKDDEMISETYNCSFRERLMEVMAALKRAEEETGKKVLYFISTTDTVRKQLEKAKWAVEHGANALMVNFISGIEMLRAVAEDPNINVPLLFHPCGMSGYTGISPMVWNKLARFAGADVALSGGTWGKWGEGGAFAPTIRSKHILQAPIPGIERIFILSSAVPGLVPTVIESYGLDVMVGGGGAVHGHPSGSAAGVKALRQAIDAVMSDIPLEEAAKEHKELGEAVALWGIYKRPATKRY
ncbi:MAG: ribulose 1,5-bisphosphate carboxylase [Chloroflexi bacterium]|nr:ribulose 1,5-bisphosphate carboxylase [Chloroflexota bacterium]